MAAKYSSQEDITVVLIGRVGSGKSSTGNTIIGSKRFRALVGTKPVTEETNAESVSILIRENQINITVIDTPGLVNSKQVFSFIDFISNHKRGRCVFLFVIRIERFTDEDKKVLKDTVNVESIAYRIGIVLTNKNELQSNNQTVEEWLRETPSLLKLFKDAGMDYVAIDNENADQQLQQQHRQELLLFIDGLSKKDKPSNVKSGLSSKIIEILPEPLRRICTSDSRQSITVTLSQLKQRFGEAGVQFYYEMK